VCACVRVCVCVCVSMQCHVLIFYVCMCVCRCHVLVASDAIGMGLNLSIRRVIFTTLSKFDGECGLQMVCVCFDLSQVTFLITFMELFSLCVLFCSFFLKLFFSWSSLCDYGVSVTMGSLSATMGVL